MNLFRPHSEYVTLLPNMNRNDAQLCCPAFTKTATTKVVDQSTAKLPNSNEAILNPDTFVDDHDCSLTSRELTGIQQTESSTHRLLKILSVKRR
jgi:hypothetical protein